MRNIISIVFFSIGIGIFAQSNKPGSIQGKVLEMNSGIPMEYCTVVLLDQDGNVIVGSITNKNGEFKITTTRTGNLTLEIGFLGYEKAEINITINKYNDQQDIGEILLKPFAVKLNEVKITSDKSTVEYKIDKKVVHVGDNLANISGNAADVLSNVPSIQVDIEGNVSLRGNSNFTVLIDGRPTVLEGSEALQQIPASTIQYIEIITNPSAKYNPEGTAGILNIITKKKSLEGFSGFTNIDIGLGEKYGGDFLFNYRTKQFNYFIGGNYSYRKYPGNIEQEYRTILKDTNFIRTSDGTYTRTSNRWNTRGGIIWYLSKKTVISISSNYGYREYKGTSNVNYITWDEVNAIPINRKTYSSNNYGSRGGNYFSINSDFTKEFSSAEHSLNVQFMYSLRNGVEEANNVLKNKTDTASGQKSTEIGPSSGLNYRINYKHPVSAKLNFETGLEGRNRTSEEINEIYYLDLNTRIYEFQSSFSHDVSYKNNYNAFYWLAFGEFNSLHYQLGFRAENTDRLVELKDTGERYTIFRWDYFPTAHFSYQINDKNQLMINYTRRINRPRGYYLEPFLTWRDAYNVRRGNPNVKPEYINSYEFSYQKLFDDYSISGEVFYNTTANKIESIRSAFNDSVIMRTYENVGTDRELGIEVMADFDFFDKWESTLTGRFYRYDVRGTYNMQDFDRSSYSWSVRWNNIINLTSTTRIQFNPSYRSPEQEAQELESGYFVANAAIQQSFLNRKLDITLQARDIFSTAKRESVIDAEDFYSYRLYEQVSPIIMLNLTWRINNYKSRKGNGRNERINGEGEDGME